MERRLLVVAMIVIVITVLGIVAIVLPLIQSPTGL